MTELIRATDFSVDHKQLVDDTNRIIEMYPFNKQNQICFQNTKDSPPDPYQGTGDSRLDHCPMYGSEERDFTEFNPNFKGTVFEYIFENFPYTMGRMRLMKMLPKRAMWMHNDPGMVRYHFAIITNENCFILYRDHGHYHIPSDGMCYFMDTEEYHSAVNTSREDRIHLVISGL